jgi:hypothetical protein
MPQLIRSCKSNRVTDSIEKSFVINGYDFSIKSILQNRVIGYGSSKASGIFVKTNNSGPPSLACRDIGLGRGIIGQE